MYEKIVQYFPNFTEIDSQILVNLKQIELFQNKKIGNLS